MSNLASARGDLTACAQPQLGERFRLQSFGGVGLVDRVDLDMGSPPQRATEMSAVGGRGIARMPSWPVFIGMWNRTSKVQRSPTRRGLRGRPVCTAWAVRELPLRVCKFASFLDGTPRSR